jgi:hypothetical protein
MNQHQQTMKEYIMRVTTYTDIVKARFRDENIRYQLCAVSNKSEQDAMEKFEESDCPESLPLEIIVVSWTSKDLQTLDGTLYKYCVAIDESGEYINSTVDVT